MKHADEVVSFLKDQTREIIKQSGNKISDEDLRKAIHTIEILIELETPTKEK
jgi:hypothetical protein